MELVKCVRSPKLLSCVTWNVIMFLSNILNCFVPSTNKAVVLIHLSLAHFGLCPLPENVKTEDNLRDYKRAVKIVGSMTEYDEKKLNEPELIAYPFISNLGNATIFSFSYLCTLNARISHMYKNGNFNLDNNSITNIEEMLNMLDKTALCNINWIYAKLESHVVFPYFATFWLYAREIVGTNNLYDINITTRPSPKIYQCENFTIVLKRPSEECVHLKPNDNISYMSKQFLPFPFNLLKQLCKIVDTNERIDKYSIYETHIVEQIGWNEDFEKTIVSMEDIVYSTPHFVNPPEIPNPTTPQKKYHIKEEYFLEMLLSKSLNLMIQKTLLMAITLKLI